MTSPLTPYKCSQMSSASSTPSTAGDDKSFWDTPETPSRRLTQGDLDPATPFTPPLLPDDFEQTWKPRIKREGLSVAGQTSPTPTRSPDSAHLCENGRSVETGRIAATATKGILFRTDLLLQIAKESRAKPQVQFNLTPSIDFCPTKPSHSADTILVEEESYIASFPISQKSLEIGSVIASDPPSLSRYKGLQATLEHTMPSDLHNRLRDYPKLCVASYVKDPSTRCTNKSRNESVKDRDTVLKAVSRCIRKGHIATLLEELEELIKILCCGNHQNVALKQPAAKPRIEKLRDFIKNLPSASEKDASTFRAWTMALAKLSAPVPTLCDAPKLSLHEMPLKTNIIIASDDKATPPKLDKTAAPPSKPASPLPGFATYKSALISNTEIIKNLKKVIAKPLSVPDLKSGFIYMFWNQGSFGMIKIGRTKDLERRLKEWQKCKSTHFYHKPSQKGELLEVPHVQRIERLMQTELVNLRRKQPCDNCNKVHEEWFQITEAKAVEVFQKWRDWILEEPYMKNDEGKWVMKPDMIETIPKLCTLEPEAIGDTKTQPRSAKDRSKRPKPRRSFAWQALDASDSVQTPRNVSRGLEPNIFLDVTVAAT